MVPDRTRQIAVWTVIAALIVAACASTTAAPTATPRTPPTAEPPSPAEPPAPATADLTDFIVPFEYAIPAGSEIRLTSAAGSALVAFVSGPALPLDPSSGSVHSGQEPKPWDAQGIIVGSAEEAWSHGSAGRFMLGADPATFLAGLRDTAAVSMGAIHEVTLDGRPALTTRLLGVGSDIHVTGRMRGLSGDYALVSMPSRLTVAQIDGTSVFILTWARTADDLAAWLPKADEFMGSFHFAEAQS